MSGVNPQGCRVASFKAPSEKDLSHDFLWRVHQEVPPKGYIGIFNRSHYEDVLITQVHGWVSDKVITQRLDQINAFEEMLAENGTTIHKIFLHISKDEQKERLTERIHALRSVGSSMMGISRNGSSGRIISRRLKGLSATSTQHAPWYVVPANRKWYRNLVVAEFVVEQLTALKL